VTIQIIIPTPAEDTALEAQATQLRQLFRSLRRESLSEVGYALLMQVQQSILNKKSKI
jgi:hypothetical protein